MPLSRPLLAPPPRVASLVILVAVFLDMAGLGVSITVLPSLIGRLAPAGQAGWINGAFVGVWALVQLFASPVLGALSDRYGRRPLMVFSMLGLGLDYAVMALAPDLAWLLAGRLVSAVSASSYSVAYAYVADTTPEAARAAAYGRLGAAAGLGFILGPAAGGLLGAVSERAPFWAAAGFSLANAALALLALPESLPRERRSPFRLRTANPLGALDLMTSDWTMRGLALIHLLTQFAGSSIASVYVLYAMRRFGWSTVQVGASLAVVGLGVALVQGLLVGRLTARLGERATLTLGVACGLVSLCVFGLASTAAVFVTGLLLFGLWGLQGPATLALMSARTTPSEQGRLQGAAGMLTSLADGVGPFVFGAIFSITAGARATEPWAGSAFLSGAGLCAVALGIAVLGLRHGKAVGAVTIPS